MIPSSFPSRDARQRGLVPPERLAQCHAVVIGVGAIGRQVALQLAALGMSRLTLVDDDHVEVENLAPQGYWPDDLNQTKVSATAAICQRIQPTAVVRTFPERFKRSTADRYHDDGPTIVFACVDRIETRRILWESLRSRCELFIDGRMSGEVVRILAANDDATGATYAQSLFPSAQAHIGTCTARSTIYTASIAAGLMIQQFTKWLRRLPIDVDVTLNLLAMELAVGPSPSIST